MAFIKDKKVVQYLVYRGYFDERYFCKPIKPNDTLEIGHIPYEIKECFNKLDRLLDAKKKKELKNMPEDKLIAKYHFGLGMKIRNEWIRHDGLGIDLKSYFSKLGVKHIDNTSAIIIRCYYRYLNLKNINLNEIVKEEK